MSSLNMHDTQSTESESVSKDDEAPDSTSAKSTMSPVERAVTGGTPPSCAIKREALLVEPSERSGLRPRHHSDGTLRMKFARLKDAVASLTTDQNRSPPAPMTVTLPPTSSRNCCPYCGLLKKGPADLQRHLRKHTGERPFICKVCQKAFKAKRSLCHHEYVHHGLDDHTDGRLAINSAHRRHGARQRLTHISLPADVKPVIGHGLTTQLQEISQRAKCGSDTNNNHAGVLVNSNNIDGVHLNECGSGVVWSPGYGAGSGMSEQASGGRYLYPPINGIAAREAQKIFPCRVCGKRFRVRSSLIFHERLAHRSSSSRRGTRLRGKSSGGSMPNCVNGTTSAQNGWSEEEKSQNGESSPLRDMPTKRRITVMSETSVVTLLSGVSTADGHAVELYRCHLCSGRLFHSLSSMLRHLASHSGDTAADRHLAYYACEFCDTAFQFRVRLDRHVAARHGIDVEAYFANGDVPLERSLASEIREQASLSEDVTVVIPADVPDVPDDPASSRLTEHGHGLPSALINVIGSSPVHTIMPYNTRASLQKKGSPPTPEVKVEGEREAEDGELSSSPSRGGGSSLSRAHSRLHVVNSPIVRDVVCRPSVLADGRAVYRCTYCHKHFATHSDINRHMDFHEDIRPYKCNFCDYFARTNSQLKVHMMRHQGIREFHCKLCNYKGVTQSDLNRHTKSQIHVLKAQNTCHICGEGFVSPNNLIRHTCSNNEDVPPPMLKDELFE